MNTQFQIRVIDSDEHAAARREELDIDRTRARLLGEEAVRFIEQGWYPDRDGRRVTWSAAIEMSQQGTVSIPPDARLPTPTGPSTPSTLIEIVNETALSAARRLVDAGSRPLVLNMANGIRPGGGFLSGARAQEESLCRSTALYATLLGDPMYTAHARRPLPDSSEWAILSPDVPVFRDDHGTPLQAPWLASFVTCAAPYAPVVGQPAAGDLLQVRIGRLLEIARAYAYTTLVLGAWGCGAFANDPTRTAQDFRRHLEATAGAFEHVTFAITDWSPERRLLRPFTAALTGDGSRESQ